MTPHSSRVDGVTRAQFEPLRAALQHNLDTGAELGASIAVIVDGEVVVDLWGGWQDRGCTVPWSAGTVVNVWSITKTISALCALLLVDAQVLDLDRAVGHYWDEFRQGGKEAVLVRHLLSHTSGLPGWMSPFSIDDLYDTEEACRRLAAQQPRWAPGREAGYQAQNYGHLIGELVRRTTGLSLGSFMRTELVDPAGADFRLGAPDVDPQRIAELVGPETVRMPFPPDLDRTAMVDAFTAPRVDAAEAMTTRWRAAELGAANGHGHARSVATLLSVLTEDGAIGDRRLLSEATVDAVFQPHSSGLDRVLGLPLHWGLGLATAAAANPAHVPV